MAFDPESFEAAMAEYRFSDAEALLALASPDQAAALRARLADSRAQAEELARTRYLRILDLGTEGSYEELLELYDDPSTPRLLASLDEAERDRVDLHLRGAERWKASKQETNRRRMAEARRALDGLDLQLARGLIARLDGRYLDDRDADDRDNLLLELSARSMELEELSQLEQQLRDQGGKRRRRWRGRKRDRP